MSRENHLFALTWRVTVLGITAHRRTWSEATTKSFNVSSDPSTNHVIVAIAGRLSAVPYLYVDGRVYCEVKSPAFVIPWVVTLDHSIVNNDLPVFNYLAITVDTVHWWNKRDKAEKETHDLQSKQGKKKLRRRMKDHK